MGAGFHGGFGTGTKGGRTIYSGTSKSSALSSVSSLPNEIQGSAKSFLRVVQIITIVFPSKNSTMDNIKLKWRTRGECWDQKLYIIKLLIPQGRHFVFIKKPMIPAVI